MSQRRRMAVAYDDVSIDTILDEPAADTMGALVPLPSLSRDSEDFDAIPDGPFSQIEELAKWTAPV